jgi:uncharacterized protein YkwD
MPAKDAAYKPINWSSTSIIEPQKPQEPNNNNQLQISQSEKKLLELHNIQRELKGRVALSFDQYLNTYAINHAKWMASKNWMKHSDVSVLLGKYSTSGENIAWNQRSEEEVMNAWMNSSGHRANILNRNFNAAGFGKINNSKQEPYWCTVFGG